MVKVKVYVATHCLPCQEVRDLLAKGHFLINGGEGQIDLIDIETEEGFAQIKDVDITGVPSAFKDGKQCRIKIDDEKTTLLLECDDDEREDKTT